MGQYKYFTDQETFGMVPEICTMLDIARTFLGAPIVLTCGYRSPSYNAEIGGVPDSAHCKGMAADVEVPLDPIQRDKLIWALGLAGFKRFEDAPRHFHIDIDSSKPTPCFFIGDDH